ncbi:MAG: FAD-dependent oxidoreductase, partial [Patescibacteria group bacterium]|nr:FAD-dependent oxidoreductase [Patescibacteria group bacterium]
MTVGIVGGGITGLTAAYELTKQGHRVIIVEKDSYLGGLAAGFKKKTWRWSLEYTYHHLFTNDHDILSLAKELGLEHAFIVKRPITANLFHGSMYQMDSVSSLLSFPAMPFIDRLRTGLFIAALKCNPFWQPLEYVTAKTVARMIGGDTGWKTIWEPLMVGKFSEYADRVAASWLWARIVKRTPKLIYFTGGFATFIAALESSIRANDGTILLNTPVSRIEPQGKQFTLWHNKTKQTVDCVLLTIPTRLALNIVPSLSSRDYTKQTAIPHLHAQVLIAETDEPILENNVYWLNITDRSFPFLAVVAHTNFMDKQYYGNKHITYIGNYLPDNHPFLRMNTQELLKIFMPYLKQINPRCQLSVKNCHLFVGPFAQPVHECRYSQKAPKLHSPIPNLFLANMDAIY